MKVRSPTLGLRTAQALLRDSSREYWAMEETLTQQRNMGECALGARKATAMKPLTCRDDDLAKMLVVRINSRASNRGETARASAALFDWV